MNTRSPGCISRIARTACGFLTPSQAVFWSRCRSSMEYESGSVLARKYFMITLPASHFGITLPASHCSDAFDLLQVIQVVARHGFDHHAERHLAALGMGEQLGHGAGRDALNQF